VDNNDRKVSIYYSAKEKAKVKELIKKWGIDEEIFTQYITPRKEHYGKS